jgi:hypothetical protein
MINDVDWFRLTGGQSAHPDDGAHINPMPPTAEQVQEAHESFYSQPGVEDEPLF